MGLYFFLNNKQQILLWITSFFVTMVKVTYRQTCLYDHLFKTTTHLRPPMLCSSKPIPIQLLLYKTTTCLTQPVTTFFCTPNEKKLEMLFILGIVSQLSQWLRCWIPNIGSRIQIYQLASRSRSFQPFIQLKLIK